MDNWLLLAPCLLTQLAVLSLQLLPCMLCQLPLSKLAPLDPPMRTGELSWEMDPLLLSWRRGDVCCPSMPASIGAGSDSQ